MNDDNRDDTPRITASLDVAPITSAPPAGMQVVSSSWNADEVITALLDQLQSSKMGAPILGSETHSEVLLEAEITNNRFPAIHLDAHVISRLAAGGLALRVVTRERR